MVLKGVKVSGKIKAIQGKFQGIFRDWKFLKFSGIFTSFIKKVNILKL